MGLGTNVAWRSLEGPALLRKALLALEESGLPVFAPSGFWLSPAWPDSSDPPFTNAAAICLAGFHSPETGLAILLNIERGFGRVRGAANAPRTLDLDLLDMNGLLRSDADPLLPHPRLTERPFVLAPLAQAAPWWRHPGCGRSAAQLLATLPEARLRGLTEIERD